MSIGPRKSLLTIVAALLGSAATNFESAIAQTQPPAPTSVPAKAQPRQQPQIIGSAKGPLPARETDYIGLIDKARKQYASSRSVDARKNTRIALQVATHDFMGLSHNAQDWVGVFKDSKKTREGAMTLEIEIAPGVTISTWDNAAMDASYGTLLKPYTPVGKIAGALAIGDTVAFSANLIGSVISTDDDMVLHPQVIAQFTKLSKIDDPSAPR
jgi:hypothetical protein